MRMMRVATLSTIKLKKMVVELFYFKHVAIVSTLISSFMLCPPWFHLNKNWSTRTHFEQRWSRAALGPPDGCTFDNKKWDYCTGDGDGVILGCAFVHNADIYIYKVYIDIYGIIWSYDHMWFHCLVEKLARTTYRIYIYLQYYDSMHSFTALVK